MAAADIPNLAALRNPSGVAPTALPLTLRMLSHVPILVSSRRSQTSGSPTHVTAKLWLGPLPAAAAQVQQGLPTPAADGEALRQQQGVALREAVSQGVSESWD